MTNTPNHYQKYLVFKDEYNTKEQKNFDFTNFSQKEYREIYILNKFLESKYHNNDKYYDMEFNIIRHFPSDTLKNFMDLYFNTQKICYEYFLNIEIVKYIYNMWNNTEHELYCIVGNIKNHLIEVVNMYEYNNISHKYYTWWLYAYFPLLEDGENMILRLIKFVYLNDTQDMLMYGIYQIGPDRLYRFFKNFMITLYAVNTVTGNGFELMDSTTGALSQFEMVAKKLYRAGYEIINDPDINYIYMFTDSNGNKYDLRGDCSKWLTSKIMVNN